MKTILRISRVLLWVCILGLTTCQGQPPKVVGGPCEGCEAIFEYGGKTLRAVDTLPGFGQHGPKLKITGTVLEKDGKTPAADVILYIYHTNRQGIYETLGNETGWARRHGFIRGWIKTGKDDRYTFYTCRPAAYPDGSEAEHVHITVKEPGKTPYWLDDFLFDDDPLLTPSHRKRQGKRGGSGIVRPVIMEGILTVERDIILGHNIPGYD